MDATPLLRPLLPLLVAQIAGIVLGEHLAGYYYPALVTAACALSQTLLHLLRRRISLAAPLILICACGYLSIQPWSAPPADPRAISNYAYGQQATVTGTIVDEPTPLYQRTRVVLAAERLVTEAVDTAVRGRLQVTVGGPDGAFRRGDRLQCQGRLKPISNFNNPNGFDYERLMRFRHIRSRMWSAPRRVHVLAESGAGASALRIDHLRRRIGGFIDDHAQGDAAAILKALVVGDRSGVSTQLRESFNRVGVSHLLAISGLHVGMVATVSVAFFRFVLALVPALLRRGWVFKCAALATLPLVVAYGLVAGMSPSTQRAVLMVSVVLLALVWGKQPDPLSTIALAGMVILTLFPPALFSISFQLSFTAVGFILMGGFPLRAPEASLEPSGLGGRIIKRAGALFWISLLAYVGTLPLIMHYFNRVSLIGVAANMIYVPLFGLLVVPAGLLAAFAGLVWPTLFGGVVTLNAAVLQWALASIEALAQWPLAAVYTITPSLLEIGCYYVLMTLMVWRLPELLARLRGQCIPAGAGQRSLVPHVITATALLLLVLDCGYWYLQRHWRQDLRMTVLSVGDGSAAILELPKGRVMLVDGGGFTDNAIFDVGQRIVAPALWRKKIRTIDIMVLSHPNSDHLNGLLFVAEHFKVGQLWANGQAQDTAAYDRFRRIVTQRAIVAPEFKALARRHDFGPVQVQILWPPENFQQYINTHPFDDPNNNSIVLRVVAGDVAMVLPGDIEGAAERALVSQKGRELKSDLLVAPHHGSRTSSTERFLQVLQPQTVIISCAAMGRYRFPHPTVAARYRQNGITVFSTADNGALAVTIDEGALRVAPTVAPAP